VRLWRQGVRLCASPKPHFRQEMLRRRKKLDGVSPHLCCGDAACLEEPLTEQLPGGGPQARVTLQQAAHL
jgi:hypothetical protein